MDARCGKHRERREVSIRPLIHGGPTCERVDQIQNVQCSAGRVDILDATYELQSHILIVQNFLLLILRLGVAGGILSLGALLSSQHLIFDLLSHFRIQYIVMLAVLLCLAFSQRRRFISIVLFFCMALHAYDVFRSQKPVPPTTTAATVNITVMSSNLLASNDDYDSYIGFVKSVSPDIIVFQEYTSAWHDELIIALSDYSHHHTVPINSPFGIAVYSKYPLIDEKVFYLQNLNRPGVEVTVSVGDKKVKVIGIHPPPPISQGMYTERNQLLKMISDRAFVQTEALVVAGDFNISPWSDHFRKFLDAGALKDGRRGQAILPTWPAGFLPLQIPIDHIVVNDRVDVNSLSTSNGLSSDHKAIWADLAF